MSEIRLNVLDGGKAVVATIDVGVADAALAALSAEPETIEELEEAAARFIRPVDNVPLLAAFVSGTNEVPWDAGILFIDLAARVVAAESSDYIPFAEGEIQYYDGELATDIWLPYHVPHDYLFVDSVAQYVSIRDRRRAERIAVQPLDARAVLYGEVLDFIARQCLAARDSNAVDPIAEIHARWLTTPRADLRGQSPRDVILVKREMIDADLQSRELQWSLLGEPAHCLARNSTAYRCAGFGTHEVVMYYELLRLLLSECWKHVCEGRVVAIADEVARLEQIKDDWLAEPDDSGRPPQYILECERKRLPLIASPEEILIDDDCPLCRDMAEGPAPVFCHLDGCNMDDDFPFSFCRTREEWEEEVARERQFEEEFDRRWGKEGKTLDDGQPTTGDDIVIQ